MIRKLFDAATQLKDDGAAFAALTLLVALGFAFVVVLVALFYWWWPLGLALVTWMLWLLWLRATADPTKGASK